MLEYINNPNVVIINVFHDEADAFYECVEWGDEGIKDFPIIIDDYDEGNWLHTIGDWFGVSWSSPRHIFLDHTFTYYDMLMPPQDTHENIRDVIDEMLDNIE